MTTPQVLLSAERMRDMSPMVKDIERLQKSIVNDVFKQIKDNNTVGNIQLEYKLNLFFVKNKKNNEIYVRKIYSHLIKTLKGLDYSVEISGVNLKITWGFNESDADIKDELAIIEGVKITD